MCMIWRDLGYIAVFAVVVLACLCAAFIAESPYIIVAVVPLGMYAAGYIMARKIALQELPKDNSTAYLVVFGYKTGGSMRSQATWEFANQYIGQWYMRCSIIIWILAELVLLLVGNRSAVAEVLMIVQVLFMVIPIFITESAINKNFDRQGNRK